MGKSQKPDRFGSTNFTTTHTLSANLDNSINPPRLGLLCLYITYQNSSVTLLKVFFSNVNNPNSVEYINSQERICYVSK